jgi:hypothetical protein
MKSSRGKDPQVLTSALDGGEPLAPPCLFYVGG